MTEGPSLLAKFIADRKLSQAEAARALSVSPVALTYYVHGGQRPRADVRGRIAKWTGGEVPESAWLTDAEKEKLGDVEAAPTPGSGGEDAA